MSSILKSLRNWLFTGLLILVPLVMTAIIVHWAFTTLDSWIGRFGIHIPGVGLAIVILVTLLIGFAVQLYVGRKFFALVEWIIGKAPGINIIYRTFRDLARTIFDADKSIFQEVVAVEFPQPGSWAIGFRTGDTPAPLQTLAPDEVLMIYIMQAFSPATGFLIAIPRSKVRPLDMKVEQAMKLVLTGGMVKEKDKEE
jgi:uncharacterized membrane protein